MLKLCMGSREFEVVHIGMCSVWAFDGWSKSKDEEAFASFRRLLIPIKLEWI